MIDFSIRQDFYIRMPADLDQFGCKYSDGAVIGRKGLVELGHVAADGRCPVDQVDLEPGRGEIKRGLNPADSTPHNQYVSKMVVSETITKLSD